MLRGDGHAYPRTHRLARRLASATVERSLERTVESPLKEMLREKVPFDPLATTARIPTTGGDKADLERKQAGELEQCRAEHRYRAACVCDNVIVCVCVIVCVIM